MKTRAKNKLVRVRDVMTAFTTTLSPDLTLKEAAEVFTAERITGAPVVANGEIVGVFAQSDLVARQARGSNLQGFVKDAMTPIAIVVKAKDSAMSAVRLMLAQGVHRLVVVGNNSLPAGIVTGVDILAALARGDFLQWGDAVFDERAVRHGEVAREDMAAELP